LWFGTLNGLVKYDGYSIKTFLPDPYDTNSISRPSITALLEDNSGNIWAGTRHYEEGGGLNCLVPATEKFTHFMHNPNDSNSISSNLILCIYQDESERLWIGSDRGLSLFDPITKKFSNYYLLDSTSINILDNDQAISDSAIICTIIEDKTTDNLLIGSDIEGLWIFDVDKKIFINFNRLSKEAAKIGSIANESTVFSSNRFCYSSKGNILITSSLGLYNLDLRSNSLYHYEYIHAQDLTGELYLISVLEDSYGLIWIGTDEQGVFVVDPFTKKIQQYQYGFKNNRRFSGSIVPSLYEDHTGIIWLGTKDYGLYKWDRNKWRFNHIKHDPKSSNSISEGTVECILEDQSGVLWIGTRGGGLNKYDPATGKYKKYLLGKSKLDIWNRIHSIVEDPSNSGVFWIGTWGLLKFDSKSGKVTRFTLNMDPYSFKIESLLIDSKGVLWVGSGFSGLYKFDPESNTYIHYSHNPTDTTSISQNMITSIYEDRSGRLWVGTNTQGINLLERETGKFKRYESLPRYGGKSSIVIMHEDKKNNFWIGTLRSGLHLFDREKGKSIENYTISDGLANNYVTEILEDGTGNLWISTQHGLSKFDPQNRAFKNYYAEDGLEENIFYRRSAFKSKTGEMYFGGMSGLTTFHPDSIKDNPIPPKVVISNVSLLDKSVKAIEYKGYLPELQELKLDYDQNGLRFDYIGLHYSVPDKNQYKYILENFNESWIDAGTQRNATYTNLDPGEYVFKVIASNSDGIWNEAGASIKIIILPPWYATNWAYIIYAIIILIIIYYTWTLQLRRIRIKHDYEMSKFEAEKMHEVDEMKSRFFANISHEFRTPLTLILGLAAKIGDRSKENTSREDARVIKRNANRLHGLVNQLLDLSKIESGNMVLQSSPINIIPLLKGLVLSFTTYAERKRINLNFYSDKEEIIAYVDKDKIEKIITNLLSNAFKFTPEGGKVEVEIKIKERYTEDKLISDRSNLYGHLVEIIVSDTGIGIPQEMMDKIFDRFYQVDNSHIRKQEGTGLGLALTKELVELHYGKIKIESEEGKGSKFTITLQLGKEHLKSEEIIDDEMEDKGVVKNEIELMPAYYEPKVSPDIGIFTETDRLLLLIVEDNTDVRNYIRGNLEEDYRILEAVDGENGYDKAIECIPDIIISDVMMPKMDGFEMCGKLKTDERTSHIPIIMLTAKATNQDKIEGYETGADDYVMKPFDTKVLRARIENLIQQRRRLIEYFKKEGIFELNESSATSTDKKFIKKALDIIYKHISDSTFSVDVFTDEIAMSKAQLTRKLNAMVGESPGDLIRKIRMIKAAKLIKEKFGNISEIAVEVGYNNPSNFAQVFKKHFGVSPSEYTQ
jgi:signal transduction histidine kinase/ligand-binding sensor domain-containing protein/DNA-binding response OmpR family regulator